jgi:hypothetical protein
VVQDPVEESDGDQSGELESTGSLPKYIREVFEKFTESILSDLNKHNKRDNFNTFQ